MITNVDITDKIIKKVSDLKKVNTSKAMISSAIDSLLFDNGGYTVKMNMGDFVWIRRNGDKITAHRDGRITLNNGTVVVTIQ
jgi:hypothetical protein